MLLVLGIPLILTFSIGIGLSILAVWLFGRKKPWFGKNSLACFLMICLYAFLWILLIGSIPVGPVGSNTLEGYPALLLQALMLGLTPVTALPVLMAYGPEKKWLTFDPMWIKIFGFWWHLCQEMGRRWVLVCLIKHISAIKYFAWLFVAKANWLQLISAYFKLIGQPPKRIALFRFFGLSNN